MKMMVKLAILFAALLLVTGVAFAATFCGSCPGYDGYCYSVDGTDLNNPANSFTGQSWCICFNGNSSFAWIGGSPAFHLAAFPEGLNWQAISWDSGNVGASMTFRFFGQGLRSAFNGLYYDGTDRFKIHGVGEYDCY